MIIDFHNHFYPPELIAAIKKGPSNYRVTTDPEGNPVLHSPGDRNYIVPGHRDIDFRKGVLDEAGVDMQVLTLTTPGTSFESPDRAVVLSRVVNDALARIVGDRGDRFTALATLPLNNPEASAKELDYAARELGMPGVMVFSSVGGVSLYDERFWAIFERASDLGMIVYIHPNYPAGVEAMSRFWLMPLVGFLFDTTLTAAGLVFSGAVERFPGVRWVLGHLGGAIPFLAERLDRGFEAFPECRENLTRPPSEFLREFYYDTVNFDPAALKLAIEFAGADHILAGSDYPHLIGSIEKMKQSIDLLDVSEAERQAIRGGNASRLLGLTSGATDTA